MSEAIAQFFVENLDGKLPAEIITFLVSMMPVLELRGGMIVAKLMDLELYKAFIICYIGNILPVPFILLLIRRIFNRLKKIDKVEKLITRLEARSIRKADKIVKYRLWGLLLFVAIPLPGTGAWTGSLAADLLDIRVKHSFPVIAAGVLISGLIMSILSYGLLGFLGL